MGPWQLSIKRVEFSSTMKMKKETNFWILNEWTPYFRRSSTFETMHVGGALLEPRSGMEKPRSAHRRCHQGGAGQIVSRLCHEELIKTEPLYQRTTIPKAIFFENTNETDQLALPLRAC